MYNWGTRRAARRGRRRNVTHRHPLLKTKRTGLLFPLFSMRSVRDWGIGDFTSLRG